MVLSWDWRKKVHWNRRLRLLPLCIGVSRKLHLYFTLMWCTVYAKTDFWFQKSHEEFEQLQISSGKSKKLKFDGLLLYKKYICPKNTFLLLKHIQNIYLTLLSTTCVKIHQITYVIFETISHFSWHNSSVSC